MVTPLIYMKIFKSKPKQDRRMLIQWLKLKRRERRNKLAELRCRTIPFWDICLQCWNCNLQCYDSYIDDTRDGYIVDGATMYDEKMQRKCFEIGE